MRNLLGTHTEEPSPHEAATTIQTRWRGLRVRRDSQCMNQPSSDFVDEDTARYLRDSMRDLPPRPGPSSIRLPGRFRSIGSPGAAPSSTRNSAGGAACASLTTGMRYLGVGRMSINPAGVGPGSSASDRQSRVPSTAYAFLVLKNIAGMCGYAHHVRVRVRFNEHKCGWMDLMMWAVLCKQEQSHTPPPAFLSALIVRTPARRSTSPHPRALILAPLLRSLMWRTTYGARPPTRSAQPSWARASRSKFARSRRRLFLARRTNQLSRRSRTSPHRSSSLGPRFQHSTPSAHP